MTTATDITERIAQIIDDHVRPFIEIDGGTIEFVRYDDGVVYVSLAGACRTCPASMLTLKGGVERHIKGRLPEVQGVELVDQVVEENAGSIADIEL